MLKKLLTIVTLLVLATSTSFSSSLSFPSTALIRANTLRPIASSLYSMPVRASSGRSSEGLGVVCGPRSFEDIFKEFMINNRLYLISDEGARQRMLNRLKYVIGKTKDIPDFLMEEFKEKKIVSIIVLGSYLWFERASDIELLIITEGKDELEILYEGFIPIEHLLIDDNLSFNGIRCVAATIGYESLKKAPAWRVFAYAIRGWREGIAIFGIDPYQSAELSSCTEKIRRLDYLLDTSKQSVRKPKGRKTLNFHEEKELDEVIRKTTTEAISVLKEIAVTYRLRKITGLLQIIEHDYGHLKSYMLKGYYRQVRRVYDEFMRQLKAKPTPPSPSKTERIRLSARAGSLDAVRSAAKVKPVTQADPAEHIKQSTPEDKGPARAQQLNSILEKHPKFTVQELLARIKRYKPQLLDDIPDEKKPAFLKDFIFLGYETKPLPKEVLEQLPGITEAGKRMAAIRKARGKKPEDVAEAISEKVEAGIARRKKPMSTRNYIYIMEKAGGFRRPGSVWDISRELEIDPIRIIDGRDWDSASADLPDGDKMRLCRARKGWPLEQSVTALEEAGFKFASDNRATNISVVANLEKNERMPTPEQAAAIRKLYCDDSLFKEVTEEKKLPADLSDGRKVRWYRENKKHWTRRRCVKALEEAGFKFTPDRMDAKVQALAKIEADKKMPTSEEAVAIREVYCDENLFKEVTEEKKVPADLSDGRKVRRYRENKKHWTRKQCIKPLEEAGFTFISDTMDAKAQALGSIEEGKRMPTPEEAAAIREVFGDKTLFRGVKEIIPANLPYGQRIRWYRENKKHWPRKQCVKQLEEAGLEFTCKTMDSKMFTLLQWENGQQLPNFEQVVVIRDVFGDKSLFKEPKKAKPARAPAPPKPPREEERALLAQLDEPKVPEKITVDEAAEMADRVATTKEAEKTKEAGKRRKKRDASMGKISEAAKEIRLKAEAVGLDTELIIFEAAMIYEFLKSPEERGLVDSGDIKESISELREAADGLGLEILEISKRKMVADEKTMLKGIRRRWLEAEDLLRKLPTLLSTELCDCEGPGIAEKASEIRFRAASNLDRAEKIRDWVKGNIKLVPEYKGYRETKASETLNLSEGTFFNRTNLMVAMLRSIGIPARYRIMTVKKEAIKDMVSTELYAGLEQTIEYILPLALVERFEAKRTTKKREWITLGAAVEDKYIIESRVVNNIDEFASEKARKAQSRTKHSAELRVLREISQSA